MPDIMTSATETVGKIAAEFGIDLPKVGMEIDAGAGVTLQASDDARAAVYDAVCNCHIDDETAQALLQALENARRAVFVWYSDSGNGFWGKMYGKLYAFSDGDVRKKTLDADTWYLTDVIAGYTCTLVFHQHRIVEFVRLDDGRLLPAVSDEEALGALDGLD